MTVVETKQNLPQDASTQALTILKRLEDNGKIVKQIEVYKIDSNHIRPSRNIINIAPINTIRVPYELSLLATEIAQNLDGNITVLTAKKAQKGEINKDNDPLTKGILLPQIQIPIPQDLKEGIMTHVANTPTELIINIYPASHLANYARRHQAGLTGEDGVGHQPHFTITRMSGNGGWERGFLPNTAWTDLSTSPPNNPQK